MRARSAAGAMRRAASVSTTRTASLPSPHILQAFAIDSCVSLVTYTAGAPPTDLSTVKPEEMPTAVRMRRLEQKTQALKERAWQLKARLEMLKEQTLGGGVGAQALIAHADQMGSSFRLIKLVYSLDGTQVFARTDDAAESLYKTRAFDIFAGPISPGNHTLQALATYRGHGYGVFS